MKYEKLIGALRCKKSIPKYCKAIHCVCVGQYRDSTDCKTVHDAADLIEQLLEENKRLRSANATLHNALSPHEDSYGDFDDYMPKEDTTDAGK